MNLKQAIKMNMFNAVLAVLNSFNSLWSANTIVTAAINNVIAYIHTLLLADGVKLTGTIGTTNNKNLARQALITLALSHAAAGRAYATNNNLPLLKQVCSVNKSTFKNTKTVDLEPLCTSIYNAILPYIANLASYGATTTSAATLNTAINNYHAVLGTPQAQRTAIISASLTIDEQIANIDNLLKESLDPLMVQYNSNAGFTQQYAAARKMQTVGTHHYITVEGLVVDIHGNPLPNAKLRIVKLKKRKHTTKTDGKYKFTRLHLSTTYTIEVTLTGYITQTFVVNEATAQTLHHNFVMAAASGGTTGGGSTPGVGTTTPSATA